jgi:hypothetical protein
MTTDINEAFKAGQFSVQLSENAAIFYVTGFEKEWALGAEQDCAIILKQTMRGAQ